MLNQSVFSEDDHNASKMNMTMQSEDNIDYTDMAFQERKIVSVSDNQRIGISASNGINRNNRFDQKKEESNGGSNSLMNSYKAFAKKYPRTVIVTKIFFTLLVIYWLFGWYYRGI